jgi:hypothetical protein
MAKQRIATGSSGANTGGAVVKTKADVGNRLMRITGFDVTARGADVGADVQMWLLENYTGLSEEMLSFTGVEASHLASSAKYTSDFTSDADSWVELTNGDATFAGNGIDVGGKTDVLRITADGGGDPSSMQRAATVTSGKYYKVTCSVRCDANAALNGSFVMLGANGDAWDEVYDHDAGHHPEIVAVNTWYDITMYGKADTTALEITVVTTTNGNTEDAIGANGILYFHNIIATEVENVAHWVPSAETHFGWCGADASFSSDAGNGGTMTWDAAQSIATDAEIPSNGKVYRMTLTVDDWVAAGAPVAIFGSASQAFDDADGNKTFYAVSGTTPNDVVFTADGNADSDIENISLKQLKGVDTDVALGHWTLRSGETPNSYEKTFPKSIPVKNGFVFVTTPGGAACILDINVYYEIL